MKRSTKIHLMVARENLTALLSQSDRRWMAHTIRENRRWHGASEARRIYRRMYGASLLLDIS